MLRFVSKTAERMTYCRGEDTQHNGVARKHKVKITQRLLDLQDELLVTLLQLWCGLEINLLADLMGVSQTLISRIWTTWIHLLRRELYFLIKCHSRKQIRSRITKTSRFFPNTRVITDCTEIQLQRLSLPSAQRKTYSTYKHRNRQMPRWHHASGHSLFRV